MEISVPAYGLSSSEHTHNDWLAFDKLDDFVLYKFQLVGVIYWRELKSPGKSDILYIKRQLMKHVGMPSLCYYNKIS